MPLNIVSIYKKSFQSYSQFKKWQVFEKGVDEVDSTHRAAEFKSAGEPWRAVAKQSS